MADGSGAWKAPGSGRPLSPPELVAPSAGEIADRVARKLTVPRSPIGTVSVLLGVTGSPLAGPAPTINAAFFNSQQKLTICGGPGKITAIDCLMQMVTTGASAGILSLIDGTGLLKRQFPVNVGAALNQFQTFYMNAPIEIPFLEGLQLVWQPITAAFGASTIAMNIDIDSIPIGQKLSDNYV